MEFLNKFGTTFTPPTSTVSNLANCGFCRLISWITVEIVGILSLDDYAASHPLHSDRGDHIDKELASKLVGTWIAPPIAGGMKSGTRTFRADGTFKVSAVGTLPGRDAPLHWEGTWTVQHGVLVEKITKCDHPEVTPIGTGNISTLVSVTDSECRFRTNGREHYNIRKRD